MKETIPEYNKIMLGTIKIKFDLTTLDNIIGFLFKDTVLRTRKVLTNTRKLFDRIDMTLYEYNIEPLSRIWIIKETLEARLDKFFESEGVITQYLIDNVECNDISRAIIADLDRYKKKINHEECKYLIRAIDDRLQFGYVVTIKEIIQQTLDQIDEGDFKSYKAVSDDLYKIATSIINIKRKTNSLSSDEQFSLIQDDFETAVTDAVTRLKDRNKMLTTSIKRLNTILAPGYTSKKLYTYLALPGGGKSLILLKSALDIKKYNKGVKTKDPSKIPTVLYITMENTVDETVERIFNMTTTEDDIRNYTPKQVIKRLKEDGDLVLTGENNINLVIKYFPNRSITTDDLYTVINDMSDDGQECIALLLDYLKRIKPAEKAASEKEELKNITNELKTLAIEFDIPVVTAQQLNRNSASIIDAAMEAKKEDVTRLVGRDGVGSAWEIIENSDWVCIVNKELKVATGDLYFTFKLLKRRYRSADDSDELRRLEYFNHPFERGNDIKLVEDRDLPKSLSVYSLSEKVISYDEVQRAKERKSLIETFEPFELAM